MNLVAATMCMVAGIEALQSVVSLLLAHTLDCPAYGLGVLLTDCRKKSVATGVSAQAWLYICGGICYINAY